MEVVVEGSQLYASKSRERDKVHLSDEASGRKSGTNTNLLNKQPQRTRHPPQDKFKIISAASPSCTPSRLRLLREVRGKPGQ
jgi:hypothetical protein